MLSLLALLRVTDVQLEHETIELRLGQLVSAFLFDWVLRGQEPETDRGADTFVRRS